VPRIIDRLLIGIVQRQLSLPVACYQAQGDYARAFPFFERFSPIAETTLSSNHANAQLSRKNLEARRA